METFVYQLVIYRQNDTHNMYRNLIFTTAVGLIKELDKHISADFPKNKRPSDTSLTKLKRKYVMKFADENFEFEIRKLDFHSETHLINTSLD
tara:strand:- start:197 stop:472 length:276 start_codon:yes stop_codon:yes gene_type:complete